MADFVETGPDSTDFDNDVARVFSRSGAGVGAAGGGFCAFKWRMNIMAKKIAAETVTEKAAKPAAKKKAAAKPAAGKKVVKPVLKTVTFSLDAPNAGWTSVVGAFNGWDIEAGAMKRGKNGLWTKTVKLPAGAYEYKFVVDGEWWADPANPMFAYNAYGTTNSLIEVV